LTAVRFSPFFFDWIIFVQLALVLISRLIESLSSITEHVIPFSSHAGRSPMFGFINLNPYSSAIIQLTQMCCFFRLLRSFS
jgi:hypothetical protein